MTETNSPLRIWWSMVSCAVIVAAFILFTLGSYPHDAPVPVLRINTEAYAAVTRALHDDWMKLLLPFQFESFEGGRIYWMPTTIFFTYAAETYLGAFGSYLLFSTLFIVVSFALALVVSRSLLFAATVAFMFAFGTQLNYVYTYGSLIPLYLVLTYAGINLAIAALLIAGRVSGWPWAFAFVVSLALLALASEWWINYATALIAAAAFGTAWGWRHALSHVMSASRFIVVAAFVVLGAYLVVRLQAPGQFVKSGNEEELIVLYRYPILMVEDVIANFFTYLYMTVTTYLPSFVSSSNSLTYLGRDIILSEQHGYDAGHQALVEMSHVFLWRFYAGVVATLFIAFLGYISLRAWHRPSWPAALITALGLMVIGGFSTHLLIKMRPYMAVPALGYKTVISSAAWTIMLAYCAVYSRQFIASCRIHYAIVGALWVSTLLAAITRPGMQARMLSEVGLVGLRDPLHDLLQFFGR